MYYLVPGGDLQLLERVQGVAQQGVGHGADLGWQMCVYMYTYIYIYMYTYIIYFISIPETN